MPPAPAPELEEWWTVIGPTLGVALLAGVVWLKNFVESKKAEPTPTEQIATQAVGAAIVDKATADAITDIRDDVAAIRKSTDARDERSRQDNLKEELKEELRKELLDRLPRDKLSDLRPGST